MKNIKTILALSAVCAMGVAGEVLSKATFITGGNSLPFEAKKGNAVMNVDFTCPAGQDFYMGECKAKCDEKLYPLVGEPDNTLGVAETCESVFGNRFVYASCHDGWTLADGKCIADACEGFELTDEPSDIVGTFEKCKAGHIMKYKYTDCHEGLKLINGDCVIETCDSTVFPYKTEPSDAAGTVTRCKSGVTTVYGYSDCTADYNFKNGKCIAKCNLSMTDLPANCEKTTDNCTKENNIYYSAECQTCKMGYILENGVCHALTKTCARGDIYYSDNTCSSAYLSDKEAIGIYAGGEHKFVISLSETRQPWGEKGKDIPELDNALSGFGIINTDILVSYNSPAAKYCATMETGGKKWFLPNAVELRNYIGFGTDLNKNIEKIPHAVKLFSTNKSPNCYHHYWSSSEASADNATTLFPCGSLDTTSQKKTKDYPVRCAFSLDESYNNPETIKFFDCTDAKVGDFYYRNGQCSSSFTSKNDVKGIVYDTENHLIMRLGTESETMYLGTGFSEGILIDNVVNTDMNGLKHTKAIDDYSQWAMNNIPGGSYYVTASRKCYDKTNGWFLPTPKQMEKIHTNLDIINASLQKANETKLGTHNENYGCKGYWSSLVKYKTGYVYDIITGKSAGIDTKTHCPAICVKQYLPLVRYNGKAIGVVFYEDSSVQKIVAMNTADFHIWGDGKLGHDVDTIPNLITKAQMLKDMDGQGNTDKILAYFKRKGIDTTNDAATAARHYAPSVCGTNSFCGKGKWYLPSAGELQLINDNIAEINLTGSKIGTGWTMGSTEAILNEDWPDRIQFALIRLGYQDTLTHGEGSTPRKVVPVLEIKK